MAQPLLWIWVEAQTYFCGGKIACDSPSSISLTLFFCSIPPYSVITNNLILSIITNFPPEKFWYQL